MQNRKVMKIKFMNKKYDDILIEVSLDNFNESYQKNVRKVNFNKKLLWTLFYFYSLFAITFFITESIEKNL